MSIRGSDSPPSLLSLAIHAATSNIAHITNLNSIPDSLVTELFHKTVASGKLTEPILKVFMATGNKEVLDFVKRNNIQPVLLPILPTRTSLQTLSFGIRSPF